jgi:hypothetical protein
MSHEVVKLKFFLPPIVYQPVILGFCTSQASAINKISNFFVFQKLQIILKYLAAENSVIEFETISFVSNSLAGIETSGAVFCLNFLEKCPNGLQYNTS